MPATVTGAVKPVLSAEGRKRGEPAVYGHYRQAILGCALVWVTPNGTVYATEGTQVWPPPCAPIDAAHVFGADLSDAEYQQKASAAQDLPIPAAGIDDCSPQSSPPLGHVNMPCRAKGAWISPTSPCIAAFSIWWRLWTGTAVRF